MSWAAPELLRLARPLAPYARASLEQAAALAARLHAEELSAEHWVAALLADEECAATRVVLHAFADPETIGIEVLALCAGIMVVGSERTLPFSTGGVAALFEARALALAAGAARVEPAQVYGAALARLGPELRARLAALPGAVLELEPAAREEPLPAAVSGGLFRSFSSEALRALGASARAAASLGRASIGPAHLVLGALETDAELRTRTSLSPGRVRMASSGLDEDPTPLAERRLAGDAELRALLAALPEGAETADVLGWVLSSGSAELRALLQRQKVTAALFERCRGVFQDPPTPTEASGLP
jgi:ClpA/ClpB-like protein